MTGYDDAVAWLRENAPQWVLRRAETSLKAGSTLGAPTRQHVEVMLTPPPDPMQYDYQIVLTGEGETILEAVQRAVGMAAG